MSDSAQELDFLFPVPSLPPSTGASLWQIPPRLPGISSHSTDALLRILKHNHTQWHIFINEKRFHNHASHRTLALWALGTDGSTLQEGYEADCSEDLGVGLTLKPVKTSPEPISIQNFYKHLGNDAYFSSYCRFFTQEIRKHGMGATMDRFLFSSEANVGTSVNDGGSRTVGNREPFSTEPQMLNRFLGGLLHPIIHTGYGAEFGIPGMIVEGLAQAAVTPTTKDLFAPLVLFADCDGPSSFRYRKNDGDGASFGQSRATSAPPSPSRFSQMAKRPPGNAPSLQLRPGQAVHQHVESGEKVSRDVKLPPTLVGFNRSGENDAGFECKRNRERSTDSAQARDAPLAMDSDCSTRREKNRERAHVASDLKAGSQQANFRSLLSAPMHSAMKAVDVLARLGLDRRVNPPPSPPPPDVYDLSITQNAALIADVMGDWGWSLARPGEDQGQELKDKIEEIVWVVCLLYGVCGWTARSSTEDGGEEIHADFVLMHLVTSSLFLPSVAGLLPPASQARLLRAYLATVLAWYISRGMPKLDIRGFLEAPLEPVPVEMPGRGKGNIAHTLRTSPSSSWIDPSEAEMRHPHLMWHALLRTASLHHDVHLTKIIRTLSHWGALLGGKEMRVAVRSRRMSETVPIHNAMQSRVSRLSGSGSTGFSHLSRSMYGDGYDVLVPLDVNGRDVSVQQQSGGRSTAGVGFEVTSSPQWNPIEREFDFEERTGCADYMLGDYNQYASAIGDPSGTSGVSNGVKTALASKSNSEESYEELRIDGSLFLRIALLTARSLGWVGLPDSGDVKRGWNFGPFEIRSGKGKGGRTGKGEGDRLISKL